MVRADLRRQGVNPLKVRKKAQPLFGGGKRKITSQDIAVFSRQLATMMSAGVPLVQAFDIVGRGHDNPSCRKLLLSIKGTSRAAPRWPTPCASTRSTSTTWSATWSPPASRPVCWTSAGQDRDLQGKDRVDQGQDQEGDVLPGAVIIVAIGVTVIIMLFVIPQFKAMFSQLRRRPAGLHAAGHQHLGLHARLLVGDGARRRRCRLGLHKLFQRSRKFRELLDRLSLKIPVIGNILHKAAVARFARTLSTMFAAGVPLVEALDSVAGATGNIVYSNAVLTMREEVATGQSLQLSMRQRNCSRTW
jgi:type IV pilus assembly protein PilC